MEVNFITTQSPLDFSGGWSGLSYCLHRELSRIPDVDLRYVGPINPAISKTAKVISKALRLMGGSGSFFPFSEERLTRVRHELETLAPLADYNFFLGVTAWIRCTSRKPYGAYLDACFRTYFNNNLKTNKFSEKDLCRIESAEKEWLEQASHVFWASAWSRDEAVRHYGLTIPNHHVVGIGGNLQPPEQDTWNGEFDFILIAQNFELKGGPAAAAALQTVRQRHPKARLLILGQRPPDQFLRQPGIEYAGFFRKSDPGELSQFRLILSSAFCLVYPTTSDTIGQVIIECGYFGCPAIAPRQFAIPEIIKDKQTGVLINTPFQPSDFAAAMLWLIENPSTYREMRRQALNYCKENLTFRSVAAKIASRILTRARAEAKPERMIVV